MPYLRVESCVDARLRGHDAVKPVTISGNPGDDAKVYQIRAVRRAVEEAKE